jgi:ribosomal protein S18 acetylase RimI-like enzyme
MIESLRGLVRGDQGRKEETMNDWRIASAVELGMPALAALYSEGFRHPLLPMQLTAGTLTERLCAESVDLAVSRVLWSVESPLGLALVARRGSSCRLAALGVIPEARGQGAGRTLLSQVLDDARERGDRAMRLEVFEANVPARSLYERCGFQVARRLLGYEGHQIVALPAALEELDPASFSPLLTRDDSLPWQLQPASFAAKSSTARCFTLARKSFAYLSAVGKKVAFLRGLFTPPGERGRGHAGRLLRALVAHFPEQRISVPPLLPEGFAQPFLDSVGFVRGALTQLELVQELLPSARRWG